MFLVNIVAKRSYIFNRKDIFGKQFFLFFFFFLSVFQQSACEASAAVENGFLNRSFSTQFSFQGNTETNLKKPHLVY